MKKIVLAVMAVLCLAVGQNAFAYDPDALDYSFGTVKNISATSITLEEYDFEGDLENTISVTYAINGETEFDNFEKIDDLKIDEDVEVYFVEENGAKVAVSLAKDEGLEDLGMEDEEFNGEDVVTINDDITDTAATEPAN